MKKYPAWLIDEYIEQINHELFNNMLPIESLKIRQHTKGTDFSALYFDGKIELFLHHIYSLDILFATLAHELVHYYQDILELPTNHNGKFFRYYTEKYLDIYGDIRWNFTGK